MVDIIVYIENGVIHKVSLRPSKEKMMHWKITSDSPSTTYRVEEWLYSYTQKKPLPTILLPFAWHLVSPYTRGILDILQAIPFGSTVSYGDIAQLLGNTKSARAVGGACGRNPFPLLIPCHRVVAADAALGGFTCGIEVKKRLLQFEQTHF